MGLYTNTGLVNHAKKALQLNTKYMWGGILREITNQYIDQLSGIPAYKNQYPPSRVAELRQCVGKNYYGVDCIGLVKSYYWSGKPNGGTGSPYYGAAGYPDINANEMFKRAKIKGVITGMPEIPGLIVYSKTHPHVGIYIGNGYTIESTLGTRGDGVVKRQLDGLWEYWFQCPYIEYKEPENKPVLFSVGDKVKIKQTAMTYAGSTIKIPAAYKGQIYTISKISGEKALLKELYSWVRLSDLERA